VLVALTGTPGTGKTSVGRLLEARGYAVLDLDKIAKDEGLITGRDEARETDEVDVAAMQERIRIPAKVAFLRSHYSHLMSVNVAIVLRCRPSVLRERLRARGWSEEKIRENVEAEAIDVITQEATQRIPFVYEVDTTDRPAAQTAEEVLAILQGKAKGHEPGTVDWTSEVLSWY
jgi:adenylate kinase